jgi:hypothetical protein
MPLDYPEPPRRTNYDRKLSRTLTLRDGTKLVTLHDAANLLTAQFGTVTRWPALEHAIEQLMQAATTGKREDIKAVTDQLIIVLRGQQLL